MRPTILASQRMSVPMRDFFLLLASTMTVMAGATLAPALPGMREAFADQPSIDLWVKIILAIPGLCIAIFAPVIGFLIDRAHKKNTLIIALLLCGITGSIGYFLHDSLIIILISRMILGIAVAGIMVTCVTLAGDYFSGPALSRYMGLQAAFGSFGGVFFLVIAGVFADINWTMPFLIYLFALLLLPGSLFFLKEPSTKTKLNPADAIVTTQNIDGHKILLCYALAVFEMLLLYLVPLHFPFFIQQFQHSSASTDVNFSSASIIGISIAIMLLTSAIVSLNYRHYSHHFSLPNLHAIGLCVIASGLFGLALSSHYWSALVGLILMGIGIGIIRPNLIVWLFSFTPDAIRGRIIGGITSCFFIGQFLCPLLTQPLISTLGYTSAYALSGTTTLFVAVVLFLKYLNNKKTLLYNS